MQALPFNFFTPSEPSASGVARVQIARVSGDALAPSQDLLAIEEPLEIRLGYPNPGGKREHKSISITMRTPGNDFELAAGFLFTEGIISCASQIETIEHCGPRSKLGTGSNVVRIELQQGAHIDLKRLERHFYTSSSCGVCGKTSIEALRMNSCPALPHSTPIIDAPLIHALPAALRSAQAVFDCTGGLHAAALFAPDGKFEDSREDVGRHNAVDKLIGCEMLKGTVPLHDRLLLVSGRASFELVQKALMGGVPVMAAVGAPSSLAVELARSFDMTLMGFVRDDRFNVYTGNHRLRGLVPTTV